MKQFQVISPHSEDEKEYLVTLSSANPAWEKSKWLVKANSKSQSLHRALLLHDHHYGEATWPVYMVTISYPGCNPSLNETTFFPMDAELILTLEVIYKNSKEKLENC